MTKAIKTHHRVSLATLAWSAVALLALAPGLAAAQAKPAAKKLYCWNENGTRICSDALPSAAVGRARQEINANSGAQTASVDRALSSEERQVQALAAAQQRADDAAAQTRKRTDQAMLLSFQSEDELRRVFEERAGIIDNNISTARYNVSSLRQGLVTLLQGAGDTELASGAVSPVNAQKIAARHDALVRQQAMQVSFVRQRRELDGEIDSILARYRTLKSAGVDASRVDEVPAPTAN